jgi:DNA-binding NtrC family response regulator
MAGYKIFIVEDDVWYGKILEHHLGLNPDYEVHRFETAKKCLDNLHLDPDLVSIDFSLPDMMGDKLFKKIREYHPTIPVIVISSQEKISVAVDLLKSGVTDYLVKDEATKDILWNSILRIRENNSLKKEVVRLREELGKKYSYEKSIIGQSEAIKKVFQMMDKALRSSINVSITGETGTGKELVARAIHYNSTRKKKPFVEVNMAAIPRELVESELFGHEKGAFTGAITRKIGKFEHANGGTIFLDEIAELEGQIQSKLLRVLQEREIVRVGGNDKVPLDIRLIVATHKDLREEVREGRFREDLFFRIMGLPIHLPPLRERNQDILLLAKFFVDSFCRDNAMEHKQLADKAKDKLMSYHFPGNVRELKAIIELAVVMSEGKEIRARDITFIQVENQKKQFYEVKSLRQYTREIVQHFLKQNNGDVVKTADMLEIGKSTIYKMMKDGELEEHK